MRRQLIKRDGDHEMTRELGVVLDGDLGEDVKRHALPFREQLKRAWPSPAGRDAYTRFTWHVLAIGIVEVNNGHCGAENNENALCCFTRRTLLVCTQIRMNFV